MKIGILTLPLHTNYGGILQAYALQTILERMGHEVIVYNKYRKPERNSVWKVIFHFFYRFLYTVKNRRICKYYNINKEEEAKYQEFLIKTQNTQKFIDENIHLYYVKDYINDIASSPVDCIVVGSDQIWDYYNGHSISGSVANAFLPNLPKNIRCFSYAASFGKDKWNYTTTQTKIAKLSIKKFTGVSVREESGVQLCNDYLDIESQVNIDPTMLLTSVDYIRIFNLNDVPSANANLLVYIIDETPEKNAIVEYVEQNLHLKHFRVNSKAEDLNNANTNIENKIQPPVVNWLRGFLDSEFVVTDSFHACVFCILFHKPFIAIGNRHRGLTRFTSLLSAFGLENCLVEKKDDVLKLNLKKNVDYKKVDAILEYERQRSLSYLLKNTNL